MKQKNFSKWVFAGAALLLGLTACNNKNEDDLAREKGYDTYSTISLSLPASLRAGEDDNYNKEGEYKGVDHIKSLTLYMIDNADHAAKPELQHFPEASLHLDGATGKVTMAPFRTKSGNKTVYAVINITSTIKTALDAAADKATFEAAYQAAYEAFGAKPIAELESGKDVIVMSGKPVTQEIMPNVSALNAPAVNNVHITLTRAAARVSVTTTATEKTPGTKVYEVKATVTGGTTKTFGTISNLVWSVGQYEKTFYLLQRDDRQSPNYGWVTNAADYPTEAPKRYDYSQLRSGKFFEVEKITSYGIDQVRDIKYKYISETTHANVTDPANPMTSGYRKGNTTYVLIKGQFTPDDEMWATGEKDNWNPGDDLFYGLATQKFYNSQRSAETAGNAANKVVTYKKGMVFYFLWVNPNVVDMTKWAMSPVYRNNIYNVDIKSFQNIGLSGNPFNPDPDPDDPDTPDPDDPDNPGPDEPLPTEKTFMVATITITPWTWHNYSIDL
ncbi:Mfa1 family fimbria major subunit [Porphyromonas endodontalis]|uniref:Mfa1 family fimbria major subunit n=1 Tax=Porphyromonas endodontalis TaxID=28124 RepID=UPI002880196B|nr:Mfa1 family fimbria major subunit [Porphyromonas endodontalis]